MKRRLTRHATALAATLLLAACGPAEPDEDGQQTLAVQPGDSVPLDSVFSGDEQEHTLPSARIYHTLTDHPWYARGEPLQHEGRAFAPAGAPVSAPLRAMRRVGDYQGVELYVRDGASDPVVYVPVFRGYWQPFRAETAPSDGT